MTFYTQRFLFLAAFGWIAMPGLAQDPCDTAPVFASGPTLVCSGSSSTYTVIEEPGVAFYVWSIGNTFYPPSLDPFIEFEWNTPANEQLCVFAFCTDGSETPQNCIDIEVYAIDVIDPEPRLVCAPDTFGANAPGEYLIHLVTPEGCDSIITLTVTLFPEGPVDLGTIYLCEGDQWELNGDIYADPGSYTVEDYLPFSPWCYREMTFRIEPISASLVSIQSIPAKQKTALPKLVPAGIPPGLTPEFTWTGPNGYVSTQMSIHPPAEGEYCLEIRFPFQSDPVQSCSIHLCQVVDFPEPPETNDTPGEADPDGSDGMKPWIYPQPASDQFCIAWPQADLHNATWTLYNRWGSLVQQGSLDHGCAALVPPAPDVYALVLVLENGTVWSTPLTVQ